MNKNPIVTKQVTVSFVGFLKDQRFGIWSGFWLGLAVALLIFKVTR